MSKVRHRQGGKFTGSHTTVTQAAGLVADIAARSPLVHKIAIGVIVPGKGGGARRIKITDREHAMRLIVRGDGAIQELWIYSNDREQTKRIIAEGAKQESIAVSS